MNNLYTHACQVIASHVDTRYPGQACLVFNSLSWDRQEPVEIPLEFAAGQVTDIGIVTENGVSLPSQIVEANDHADGSLSSANLLFQAHVPSCGYQLVFLKFNGQIPSLPDHRLQPIFEEVKSLPVLENSNYRIDFHPSGALAGIFDKVNQKAVLGPNGAGLVFEEDLGCFCHIDPDRTVWEQSDFPPARIEILEAGPLRWRVIVNNLGKGCSYQMEIALYEHSPLINFKITMDIRSGED